MPDGNQRQFRLIGHVELLLDVVEMSADGRSGEFEVFGDPLHRRATREADEYFELPLRKALDRRLGRAIDFRKRKFLRQVCIDVALAGRNLYGDRKSVV